MTAANSPMFALGLLDGQADAEAVAMCPPGVPLGPQPPYPAYRVMYDRGYAEAWSQACVHSCPKCRRSGSGQGRENGQGGAAARSGAAPAGSRGSQAGRAGRAGS